jgi:cobalt-zinc-cadmium efflux system membrane fusion protein
MKKREYALMVIALAGGILAGISISHYIPIDRSVAQKTAGKPESHSHEAENHQEEKAVRLTAAEMKEFGIEVRTAGPSKMAVQVTLPGEIVPNMDRMVHIVPRAPGVIRQVFKFIGDQVRAGELMAVLDSREVADAKAAYLASQSRLDLAQAKANREEMLWRKRISPEQDYQEARNAFEEAKITLKSAEQKLHAMGFSESDLVRLSSQPDETYTSYEIRAPFEGTVIEKHLTIGEVLKEDAIAFTVADLSTVWVKISVYQKDMLLVRKGQRVLISPGKGISDAEGTISYVEPMVREQTRTAMAIVVLPNPEGLFRPGLYVVCLLDVEKIPVSLLIPKTALIQEDRQTQIFIETPEGFVLQPMTLGRSNEQYVEVLSGIKAGQRYVAKGGFTLKAQLSKGTFGEGHGH